MNKLRLLAVCMLSASLFLSAWCFAGEKDEKTAINQIAEVMHRLKHYPSPQGKRELQAILQSKSTTTNERIIANAMLNFNHHPASEDVPLLEKISNDKTATYAEREIASIVINFNHRPSTQDKNRLKELMQ